MGIPVNDPEDPAGYDCKYASNKMATPCKCSCSCSNSQSASSNSSCSSGSNCNSSNSGSCKHIGSSNNAGATTLTLTFANNSSCGAANNYQYGKTETFDVPLTATAITRRRTRDLVGNSKEYRIESNKCDLRIIGNGNRIRIGCNQGNLQIIGNNTRLKITNNTGGIRYTGNEGRICLGSDSTQQIVDYIGNNGKLKVVKAAELLSEKIKGHKQNIPKNIETTSTTTTTPNVEQLCAASAKINVAGTITTANATFPTHSTPKKVKVKSASFAGEYSAQWRKFNELFAQHDWRNFDCASMPNLKCENVEKTNAADVGKKPERSNIKSRSSKMHTKSCKIDSNIDIVSTYGNICIKNAVNVSM